MATATRARKGRRGRRGGYRPLAEINVTPFVDVVLVLLIIFMISAPLITAGVDVDLPSGPREAISGSSPPVQVGLAADGSYRLDGKPADLEAIRTRLRAVAAADASFEGADQDRTRVFLQADERNGYGAVMAFYGEVAQIYPRVTLVTDLPD